MQITEKTAKEVYNSLQKVSHLKTFGMVETVETFAKELSNKPYYIRYKELFYVCIGLSFVAQIASLISSYKYFEGVFHVAIVNPYILVLAVGTFLITIEVLKRILAKNSLQSWFGLQRIFSPLPTLFAAVLSVLSMYASVIGGGSLGVSEKKETLTETLHHTNLDSLAKTYDNQIATIRNEIASITHRNSYKGNTYLPTKERNLVHQKEAQITSLLAAKDNEILNAKNQAAKDIETVRAENHTNKVTYQYWFLGFELLFLACMFFVYDYKRKVVLENILNDTTTPGHPLPENNRHESNTRHEIPNSTSNKIGFVFGKQMSKDQLNNISPYVERYTDNSKRKCIHCGNEFTFKHWNKKYCNEICRIASWETKTGKQLTKKKR